MHNIEISLNVQQFNSLEFSCQIAIHCLEGHKAIILLNDMVT